MNELFDKVKNNFSTFGWFVLKLAIITAVLYKVGYFLGKLIANIQQGKSIYNELNKKLDTENIGDMIHMDCL